VINNWGNNKTAQQKSLAKRVENGSWPLRDPWNRGKTKETDERIAKACDSLTNEEKTRRSSSMKKQWKSGSLKPLTGPAHSQWKGGTSSIGAICNSNNRLYDIWKYPALKRAGFKCERCSETKDLHVHHSETRMSEIIRLCAPENASNTESSWEEKQNWANRVVDWHRENNPAHEVLCRDCHAKEHPCLNL
jgi:hypothetical protein